jgi:hypothetical protein
MRASRHEQCMDRRSWWMVAFARVQHLKHGINASEWFAQHASDYSAAFTGRYTDDDDDEGQTKSTTINKAHRTTKLVSLWGTFRLSRSVSSVPVSLSDFFAQFPFTRCRQPRSELVIIFELDGVQILSQVSTPSTPGTMQAKSTPNSEPSAADSTNTTLHCSNPESSSR